MGNAACKPLAASLRVLLKSRGIRISQGTVSHFLDHINDLAPWFWSTGSLTLPSWEKLKRDLLGAKAMGKLDPMDLPLWELVRACLADEDASELHLARQTLDKARSECSEMSAPPTEFGLHGPPVKPDPQESSESSGSDSESSEEEVIFMS